MLIERSFKIEDVQNIFIKNFMQEKSKDMLKRHERENNKFYENEFYYVYYDFETEHCAFKSKDCNVKNHRYVGTVEIIFNLNQVISIFNLEI